MAMQIRNWSKFQHYKDRNPPWIKLHYELLSSRDWVALDDASRVLAIACMLVASRNDGRIPTDSDYMQRVAYLNTKPNFKPLIACGFIEQTEDASNTLADASNLIAFDTQETETETEITETDPDSEKEPKPARARVVYGQEFLSFWAAYPKKIGKDAAWKSWKKTKPPIEEVLSAISAQIETPAWKKEGGQFIPNPATWLNQGRWKDEIPAEEKITPQEANAKQLRAAFGKDYNPQ